MDDLMEVSEDLQGDISTGYWLTLHEEADRLLDIGLSLGYFATTYTLPPYED